MIAVKMSDEYMTEPGKFQMISLELELRAFAAVNHIKRAAMVDHGAGGIVTQRRFGTAAPESMDVERIHIHGRLVINGIEWKIITLRDEIARG